MQLKAALQDGHYNLSASEAEQLLEQVDLQHRGLIDFEEWAAAMADWRSVSSGRMRRGGLGWGWAGIRHWTGQECRESVGAAELCWQVTPPLIAHRFSIPLRLTAVLCPAPSCSSRPAKTGTSW